MPFLRPWVSLLLASIALAGDGPRSVQDEWRQSLERQVDRLVEDLGSDDVAVREAASTALLPMADLLIDRLRRAAASEDDLERKARLEALIDHASDLAQVDTTREVFLKYLKVGPSEHPEAYLAGALFGSRQFLQKNFAEPSVVGLIRANFPPADRPPMLTAALVLRLADRSPFVSAGACRMLGVLEAREAIPLLRERLSHPLRWMALSAVEALFLFPDPDLAPLLIDDAALHLATDKDRVVIAGRRRTWLLEVCRRHDWDALADLLAADARWREFLSPDAALWSADPKDALACDRVLSMLDDRAARAALATARVRCADGTQEERLRGLLGHAVPEVRAAALQELGAGCDSPDEVLVSIARRALDDPSLEVRLGAAEACVTLGFADAIEDVLQRAEKSPLEEWEAWAERLARADLAPRWAARCEALWTRLPDSAASRIREQLSGEAAPPASDPPKVDPPAPFAEDPQSAWKGATEEQRAAILDSLASRSPTPAQARWLGEIEGSLAEPLRMKARRAVRRWRARDGR